MSVERGRLLRWLLGGVILGGLTWGVPGLGSPAGAAPNDHNPRHSCTEAGGTWVSSGGYCAGANNDFGDNDDGDGTTIQCVYRPPFGEKGMEWSDAAAPGDLHYPQAGAAAEILRLFGIFNEEREIEIPEDAPQWFKDELQGSTDDEGGECYLAERLPELPDRQCWRESGGQLRYIALDSDHDAMIPDLCWGTYPSANYDIGFSAGGLTEVTNKFWGGLTAFVFKLGQWGIRVSFWLMGEARSFDMVEWFGGDDGAVMGAFEALDTELVDGLPLKRVAWLALVGYLAFAMVRGKVALAGGELVITIVMLALAGVIMANPQGYLEGTSDLMSGLSNQVLATAATDNAEEQCGDMAFGGWEGRELTPEERQRREDSHCSWVVNLDLQRRLHRLFVEIPYDYVNWGASLEDHPCEERRNHILSTGGHGTNSWPRAYMGAGGPECEALASFNQEPNGERLMSAVVTAAAALVLSMVLGLMSLTILLAKFVAAVLFALAPLAAVAAILPNAGRKVAWMWGTTLLQAIVVVVAMSGLMAVGMLLIVPTVETALDAGGSPVTAYIMVAGPLAIVWIGRRKALSGLKNFSDGFADKMARFNPGSGGGPSFAGAGGGGGGQAGGQSLFGAPRAENFVQGMTAASTGATAAMAGGAMLARGARGVVRAHNAPFRAGGKLFLKRREEKRRANLAMRNSITDTMLTRKRERAAGGGGGGGGGGSPTPTHFGVPQEIWDGMKARHKRMRERHYRAEQAVQRYRASGPRTIWSPLREWGIRRREIARAAFGDHNLLTRRGRAIRGDRSRYADPTYELGKGRSGRTASKEFARHGVARWPDDEASETVPPAGRTRSGPTPP